MTLRRFCLEIGNQPFFAKISPKQPNFRFLGLKLKSCVKSCILCIQWVPHPMMYNTWLYVVPV